MVRRGAIFYYSPLSSSQRRSKKMTCRLLRNIAIALRQNAETLAAEKLKCERHWEALEQQRLELMAIAQEASSEPCGACGACGACGVEIQASTERLKTNIAS